MPLWAWLALTGVGAILLSSTSSRGSGGGGYVSSQSAMDNVNALPPSFWGELWAIAGRLGTNPYVLGLLLFEESNLDPRAENAEGCVGMNQFCPGTYEYFVNMPAADYVQLSAEQQLPYIEKYWASKPKGSLQTARDIFWISFLPATWVADAPADHVITTNPAILRVNPLSSNGTSITAGDIDAYLARVAQSPAWKQAESLLQQADPSTADTSPGDATS